MSVDTPWEADRERGWKKAKRRAARLPPGILDVEKDVWAGGYWYAYSCCGYVWLQPFDADDLAGNYCPSCGVDLREKTN